MRIVDVVRKVAPKARQSYLLALESGDSLFARHNITTPKRTAHFLAQVLHESGGLTIEFENMNYRSPERIMQIFGVGHHSAAVTSGEARRLVGKPKELAERVYGLGNSRKAKELGNDSPGDGYRFRGGGIMQTTGRDNYRRMGQKCGVDFEADPTLVCSAEHALKPALMEWTEGRLNQYADQDDILSISRKINLGNAKSSRTPNNMADRKMWLKKVRAVIDSIELKIEKAK